MGHSKSDLNEHILSLQKLVTNMYLYINPKRGFWKILNFEHACQFCSKQAVQKQWSLVCTYIHSILFFLQKNILYQFLVCGPPQVSEWHQIASRWPWRRTTRSLRWSHYFFQFVPMNERLVEDFYLWVWYSDRTQALRLAKCRSFVHVFR